MEWVPNDWLIYLMRWLHVIAGIMWIGNSFYFMWLDANLEPSSGEDPLSEGSLWMVHSGGFYQVERRKISPGSMPAVLHWFKWEATFTWITGFFLLGFVYYAGNSLLLLNPAMPVLSPAMAAGLSIALLVLSWIIYDLFFLSRWSRSAWFAHPIMTAILVATAYVLCQIYSGRGAFMQLGAMFGTIMVLNVWIRILPAQSRMIAATKAGTTPDFEEGKKAKRRSVHNSYLTLPVLFIMLSNHAPQAYGHSLNWLLLLLLIVGGMLARHAMILQTKRQPYLWVLAPILATATGMAVVVNQQPTPIEQGSAAPVTLSEVRAIIHTRCVPCHAREPKDNTFGPMPGGVTLETDAEIERFAERIHFRAVETMTMPVGNKTQLSAAERQTLGRWYAGWRGAQGGPQGAMHAP
jgi:uncharacterized membrane protein